MRWEFDSVADALYVHLNDAAVTRQREMPDGTIVDLDASGAIVGIDIVSASAAVDIAGIVDAFGLGDDVGTSLFFILSSLTRPVTAPVQVEVPQFAPV